MTIVVSVRFKDSGRAYYFDPLDLDIAMGDMVIVETIHGPEIGRVTGDRFDVPEEELPGELKPVLRHAEEADFERKRKLQENLDDVLARCNQKIHEHNLDMRLVKAEYNLDGSRLTFYFTADQRVDFRLLVRDLARTFRTRIELRQIGPRDEARILGGIGLCGRRLCCATFLPNYARVSVKMAKDQDLPLNPSKISGVCGRLLCCLSYEHSQYCELKSGLPRRGAPVQTPDGPGEVLFTNVLQQMVMVQLTSSGMQESYPVAQLTALDDAAWQYTQRGSVRDDFESSSFLSLDIGDDDGDIYDVYDLEEEEERSQYQGRTRQKRQPGPQRQPSSGERAAGERPTPPGKQRPRRSSSGPPRRGAKTDDTPKSTGQHHEPPKPRSGGGGGGGGPKKPKRNRTKRKKQSS
jgi:cell fate regulator YaaT (PSP1 superfamily)